MFYEYHELIGNENPIYKVKPDHLLFYTEIEGDLIEYEEVGFLEINENGERTYEPLYAREGE